MIFTRKNLWQIFLTLIFWAVCFVSPAYAAINDQMTFFGSLNDTSGNLQSGSYDMVFRFYDAASGGTLLDTSTHTAGNGNPVSVSNGEFAVKLGSGAGNSLDGLDFNTAPIYVGLTIGADSEMTPRTLLTSSAYSFNTDKLDSYEAYQLLRNNASGTISTSSADTLFTLTQSGSGDSLNVFDGGSEVFTIIDGGAIGIGTSTPGYELAVAGEAYLTGAFYDNSNSAGTSGMVLQTTGSGFAWVATSSLGITGGGGSSLFTDGGATTYLTSLPDNLLIGPGGVSTSTSYQATNIKGNNSLIDLGENTEGITFNGDGTKFYYYGIDTNTVFAFDLSVAYDIKTAAYNGEHFYNTTDVTDYSKLSFNDDGTRFYISDQRQVVYMYTLSTAYDISSAVFNGDSYSTSGPDVYSYQFNSNGTQLFLLQGATAIHEYDLSSAYDITTAIATGDTFAISGVDFEFNASGTKLYTVSTLTDTVSTYDLSVAFDITTASASAESLLVSGEATTPEDILFSSDGSQLLVLDTVREDVYVYDLGTNYDVSSGSYSGYAFLTEDSESAIQNIQFNNNGTKFFVIGSTNDRVFAYDLGTAYDFTTLSYAGESFSVSGEATGPLSMDFNDDGTIMYVNDFITDTVYAYNLSTAFDINTASYSGDSYNYSADIALSYATAFNDTGSKMYIMAAADDTIYTYQLSVPFDVTTASATAEVLDVSSQDTSAEEMVFASAGARLYVYGASGKNVIIYDLSTPYDLDTATFVAETLAFEEANLPTSLVLGANATQVVTYDNTTKRALTYDIAIVNSRLTIGEGTIDLVGDSGISSNGVRMFAASSTLQNLYLGELAGGSVGGNVSDALFIGYEAGRFASSTDHDSSILMGYQAGRNLRAAASNTLAMGYQAGYQTGGLSPSLVGTRAGYNNIGDYAVAIGYEAGYSNTGNYLVAVGYQAAYSNSGDDLVAIGVSAGENNTGDFNVLVGSSTGRNNSGSYNNFFGAYSGENNTADNVFAMGQYSATDNTGADNVFIGRYTGNQNDGIYNTIVGHEAGRYLSGTSSTLVGAFSFSGTGAYTANNNTALGYRAGYAAQTGANNNVLLGYQAADNLTTGSSNIVIGYDVDLPNPAGDEQLVIGNLIYGTSLDGTGTTLSTGSIGIGTSTPTAQLHTTGSVRLSNFGAGTLQTDASGNVSVSSDERLKNITATYTAGISSLINIEPITFNWSEDSGFDTVTEYLGFSAQNVKENIPGAVGEDKHGFLTLSDRGILATVVNALKEIWHVVTLNEELLVAQVAKYDEIDKRSADQQRATEAIGSQLRQLENNLEAKGIHADFESRSSKGDDPVDFVTVSTTSASSTDAGEEGVDEENEAMGTSTPSITSVTTSDISNDKAAEESAENEPSSDEESADAEVELEEESEPEAESGIQEVDSSQEETAASEEVEQDNEVSPTENITETNGNEPTEV